MEEKTKNLWKAIGVSLGIAVVGADLWGVIYRFGWFVGIIAYFTSFMMVKMFNKFYDEECKWKYAYVLIVVIVFNTVASFISLARYAADVWGVDFGEAFKTLIDNFSVIATDFAIDSVIGILCTVFGVVSVIKIEKRRLEEKAYAEQQAQREQQAAAEEAKDNEKPEETVETKESNDSEIANVLDETESTEESKTEKTEENKETVENKTEVKSAHKFCTSCGAKLNEGDKTCAACGAPVED